VALQAGEASPGVATGWPDVDRHLILDPAMLHIWAARPGVGKSALALALARNLAQRGEPVEYYSLEMKRGALVSRLIAMESGIDGDKLRRGLVSQDELSLAAECAGRIAEWPIHIVDRFDLSTIGLRAYARRRHAHQPAALLVVDHLGLLVPPRAENRNVAVGEITRGLVHLAGELGTPVLALSQLNRDIERRATKVPSLADLRDSGNIEQDAATVTFLHRPELYDDATAHRGVMELHTAKNRNGSLGVATLQFDAATMRICTAEAYRTPPGYEA
jgi:replicative DNA helicase